MIISRNMLLRIARVFHTLVGTATLLPVSPHLSGSSHLKRWIDISLCQILSIFISALFILGRYIRVDTGVDSRSKFWVESWFYNIFLVAWEDILRSVLWKSGYSSRRETNLFDFSAHFLDLFGRIGNWSGAWRRYFTSIGLVIRSFCSRHSRRQSARHSRVRIWGNHFVMLIQIIFSWTC